MPSLNMSDNRITLIVLEATVLAVLTIGIYLGTITLFLRPPECLLVLLNILSGDGFSSKIPLVIIFAFNAIWFVSIKFWPLKNVHVKLVLSSLLIAFSASFVTIYVLTNMLRDSHWD